LRKRLARGLGRDSVVEAGALVAQRLDPLFNLGRRHDALDTRRPRIDRPNGDACRRLAFDAQRGRIETGWEVARDQRRVALRQIDGDQASYGGPVRIDRDGVDGGTNVELCGGQRNKSGENQNTRNGQMRK
jgi:hypothetical protein